MSTERLELEAERLASELTAKAPGPTRALMPRVRDNGRILLRCYRTLARVIRHRGTVPPAAAWLVENFHVVESAFWLVRSDLPRGIIQQFHKMANGTLAGYTRMHGLL